MVIRSSIEAEYWSWLRSLLIYSGFKLCSLSCVPCTAPVIFCDNQFSVMLAHNPVLHTRTKHMEIDFLFVWEKVLAKQFSRTFVV